MSKARELVQPVETEAGERILPGTRRPDGTMRKERKIRPGYTPQDEQPVYTNAHVLARQNVPVCPGMDPGMLAEAQQAKSKAALKNEKRKEKKAAAPGEASGSAGAQAVQAVTAQLGSLSTSAGKPAAQQTQQPPQPSQPTPPEDPKVAAEKALRNLKKKVRQAEALLVKQAAGAALSAEEQDKVSKLPSWLEEVQVLEATLASLQ